MCERASSPFGAHSQELIPEQSIFEPLSEFFVPWSHALCDWVPLQGGDHHPNRQMSELPQVDPGQGRPEFHEFRKVKV